MRRLKDFLFSELGRIILGVALFLPAFILDKLEYTVVSYILYIISLVVSGYTVFIDAVKGIIRSDFLDEKFLMSIAAIGAVIIGEVGEGAGVMLFFLVGEYFEHKAVNKSRKSIKELMDIRPDEACVLTDAGEKTVDADDVEVGSTIIIRAGDRVPLDSVIISGCSDIDTSALSGESIPRSVKCGDEISAGSVLLNGVLTAKTVRKAEESSAARILSLVENASERKSKAEAFITKFSRVYTPFIVISALLVAVIPPIFRLNTLTDSVYNALVFLVISCPCALVISVPMAFFGGIGGAASKGILYKGGNTFSSLAKAGVFAFDKTGTLTNGEFTVTEIRERNTTKERLLNLAASAEFGSNHPIAAAIKKSATDLVRPQSFTEIAGRGTSALISGKEVLVGNISLMHIKGVAVADGDKNINGAVYVAENGVYLGALIISDTLKPEAKSALLELKRLGVKKTVLLSGDKSENALRIGKEVGVDEIYGELLPEDKYKKLESIIETNPNTVYVGDGINDAPSLALASVGVAMGQMGSDSAIESADLVIMSDNLSRLPEAVKIARRTTRIATENIIFALGVKGAILILGALGIANMWLAVFADVGVAVLAILNAMRALKTK
jgi:Cd2+/Zn2+-exporting ATPase